MRKIKVKMKEAKAIEHVYNVPDDFDASQVDELLKGLPFADDLIPKMMNAGCQPCYVDAPDMVLVDSTFDHAEVELLDITCMKGALS